MLLQMVNLTRYRLIQRTLQCTVLFEICVSSLRHVILPKELAELVPRTHLMTESEWRNLGVQQSPGWIHYLIHAPGKE